MVSEPVFARVHFRGDVELEASWMGQNSLGRPDNYALTFVDEHGAPLPKPDAGPAFGGQTWVVELAHRVQDQELLLPHWVSHLAPGHYTLRAETTVRIRVPQGAWREEHVVAEAAVDVVPDDAAAMAKVIERLGARALGADRDAASDARRMLATIHDPRTIPAWLRVIARPSYEDQYAALRALERYPDDRALAAIVRVSQLQAGGLAADCCTTEALRDERAGLLRVAAAQALAASVHARAWPALLAMKADPVASVRLTVLQRGALLPRAEARGLLHAFEGDPDALVRGEAARLLAATP